MTTIGIIVGTTRPGRRAHHVAAWVLDRAQERRDAHYEVLDLADFDLPVLDEPVPARAGDYRNPHTKKWSDAVAAMDGFVIVTPEYNHSMPGSLKNALDYLYAEWVDKAAGFVGYGVHAGARAVEHLRLVLAELGVATVRAQVGLTIFSDFAEDGTVQTHAQQTEVLDQLLDQVVAWSAAMHQLRATAVE